MLCVSLDCSVLSRRWLDPEAAGDLGALDPSAIARVREEAWPDAADADEVTSPTFTLIHEYEGTRTVHGRRQPVRLYHLDLYRIDSERQL